MELCAQPDYEHGVTLFYERGRTTPTWSQNPNDKSITLLDPPGQGTAHGGIIAIDPT